MAQGGKYTTEYVIVDPLNKICELIDGINISMRICEPVGKHFSLSSLCCNVANSNRYFDITDFYHYYWYILEAQKARMF